MVSSMVCILCLVLDSFVADKTDQPDTNFLQKRSLIGGERWGKRAVGRSQKTEDKIGKLWGKICLKDEVTR